MGYCRERGLATVAQGSLNALPFADDTFDGVIGVDVLKATYVNLPLLLPLPAMVKTGRLAKGGPNLKLDYALVPGAINRVLTWVVRMEARLLARASLPLGTSIACVAVKPGAGQ